MSLLLIAGPANAGPGERHMMLTAAAEHFEAAGVERSQIVRVDVPGRGAGEERSGSLRAELEPMVPLLQSGSLFATTVGLEVVDAQNMQAAEVSILTHLLRTCDLDRVEVIILLVGTPAKALATIVSELGTKRTISKIWERQAAQWLEVEVTARGLSSDRGAVEALLQRFGTDTSAMAQALDQLQEHGGKITRSLVLDWFKNRPDEPTFHITDAISKGDAGTALRRLSDFLVHGHPLVYLAALESDLRKRAFAAAAPDEATFRSWLGVGPSDRGATRIWSQRGRVRESSLARAQQALVRADRVIKSQPEEVHRVTLERLTVALCRWYR